MREANRGTESKDPLPAGKAIVDARISYSKTFTTTVLLGFLLFLPGPLFGQTARRFPNGKSELASPDGRWILQNVDRDTEPHHSILLKDKTTGKTRKICDYERHASIIWSPDSRNFALNDYAGSDFATASIISVDEAASIIKLQDEIRKTRGTREGEHEYYGVVRWLDERRVMVHDWGHGEPAPRDFCMCYVYTLDGSVRRCARQPEGKHLGELEDYCSHTTP